MPSRDRNRPEQKGKKVWRGKYRDLEGVQRVRMFALKSEARTWEADQLRALKEGTWVNPFDGKTTFKVYAEAWLERQISRKGTEVSRLGFIKNHFNPAFGKMAMSSIRGTDIQAWAKASKLAPVTVKTGYTVLATIFNAAVEDRVIHTSPCSKKVSLPEIVKQKIIPMEPEQVEAMAAEMPANRRALVMLAAWSGLRLGECLGLTVDRVDFLRHEIHVDRQLVQNGHRQLEFGPPKTVASFRDVPLPDALADALAAHIQEFGLGEDGLLFKGNRGGPLYRQVVGREWNAAAKRVGIKGFTFHDLRHHYASILIREGVSPKALQVVMGHGSLSVTLDLYTHMFPGDLDVIRKSLNSLTLVVRKVVRTSFDNGV